MFHLEPAFSVNCFGVLSVVVVNPVDLKIIIGFIILAILLIGSGLMSASEVAYFSLRPEDIEKLRNDKSSKNQSVL